MSSLNIWHDPAVEREGCGSRRNNYTFKEVNYSRPGRVWLVASRLGTGKSLNFFYSVGRGHGSWSYDHQKCIILGRSTERNIPAAEQPLTRAGDTDRTSKYKCSSNKAIQILLQRSHGWTPCCVSSLRPSASLVMTPRHTTLFTADSF